MARTAPGRLMVGRPSWGGLQEDARMANLLLAALKSLSLWFVPDLDSDSSYVPDMDSDQSG